MILVRTEQWGELLYHGERDEFFAITDAEAVRMDRPVSVGCLVTGRCNLHCPFCYGDSESLPQSEISAEQWRSAFRKLRSWGVMRVDISGGEPTLRSDIVELIRAALDAELAVVLSTNGTVISQETLLCIPSNVRIHVSLDSGFAEVHASSHRNLLRVSNATFERAVAFIGRAAQLGHPVRALTCVGKHNYFGLHQLAEVLTRIGVFDWSLSRILRAGRAKDGYDEKWNIDDELVAEQVGVMQEVFPYLRIRFSNRTQQDGYFLMVLPDGSVATQRPGEARKATIGGIADLTLDEVRASQLLNLDQHGQKWISQTIEPSNAWLQEAKLI